MKWKKKIFISKKILFIFGILFLINFVSAVSLNPYSHYLLNENNGTSVGDSSGNNRNGIAISSPAWVSGKLNSALQFNGINQYVNFSNVSIGNFERNETHSFEFWFRTNNTGQQIFMSKMLNSGNYNGWEIWFEGTTTNKTYFDLSSIASTNMIRVYFVNNSISDNKWHNLIVTYDGSSTGSGVKFYFDGVLKSTLVTSDTLSSSTLTATPFQISGRGNGAIGIIGTLDEIAIYNKVLNQSDVDFRYNNGTGIENMSSVSCSENWVNYNATCGFYNGTWNKFMSYYLDGNNCGTNITLPSNNGTLYDCNYCTPSFVCSFFNETCQGNPPTSYKCMVVNDTTSCCGTTGLAEDCIYTGNLSDFDINTTIEEICVRLGTFPYVELNATFHMELDFPTNNLSVMKIYITELDGNVLVFNFSYIPFYFYINLLFAEEGDYPFIINGTNPCYVLSNQMAGTFLVRESFNVTFCGFETKTGDKYENDFAYLTAELTSSRLYGYDKTLETFLIPLGFKENFKTPVFHTYYDNGCGTLRIFERNQEYAIRLFDGEMTFPYTFSEPNITKTYGTNIYIGKYYLNGSNQSFNIYFENKDIHQYRWLFNLLFVISLGLIIVISAFLFFVIPDKPTLSMTFGLGGTIMVVILRIVVWLYWG